MKEKKHQDLIDEVIYQSQEYNPEMEAEEELLRRLTEADTLRKESEELRKDKARLDYFDNLPKGMAFVIAADLDGVTYIIADSSQPVRKSIDNALVRSTATTL
jgi:hypothetical protein